MENIINDIDLAKVELALPSLIAKLRELQGNLSAEEQTVFEEIIQSAALHSQSTQSHAEGNPEIFLYNKPQSTHSTISMKAQYMQLPKYLGFEQIV